MNLELTRTEILAIFHGRLKNKASHAWPNGHTVKTQSVSAESQTRAGRIPGPVPAQTKLDCTAHKHTAYATAGL